VRGSKVLFWGLGLGLIQINEVRSVRNRHPNAWWRQSFFWKK
jgi:hypothetical protein